MLASFECSFVCVTDEGQSASSPYMYGFHVFVNIKCILVPVVTCLIGIK